MTTPQRLEITGELPDGTFSIRSTPSMWTRAAIGYGRDTSAEIVRRYNLHDELVKALENWIVTLDSGVCPHGNSGRYPTSAWFCDDCVQQTRDALARARKEGTE